MEMLAIRIGWEPDVALQKYASEMGLNNKYDDVQCSRCPVAYVLYGNILARDEAPKQAKWLSNFIASQCPDHWDFIRIPDPPK